MKRFLSNFFYNIFLICFIISIFILFHSETKSESKVLAGLNELHDSLIKISNKTINSDNLTLIDDVVKNSYDLEKMGKIIIGVDWKKMQTKSKKEFINVFKTSWLTVAAGLPIDFYEKILGPKISIFRTIPNIPAEVSRGVTAIVRNKNCNQDQTLLAKNLLQSIGQLVELDDENLMDAVTAISGSGPAYFYYPYFLPAIY